MLLGRYRHPARVQHLIHVFHRMAPRSGYRCVENETYFRGEFGPYLALPEIVLCPSAFQFPGGPQKSRVFLGDFVELDRAEESLALDGERPLVLASLGTAAHLYPHAPRFFRAVVEASRLRPDWQFVLHTADHPIRSALGGDTFNLLVRSRVPQIALLCKAAVMVTHGGINSIMECVHLGVPMVIFPGLRDQPGNAARARHHHLAIVARMSRVTPAGLVDLLQQAVGDPSLRDSVLRFRQRIVEEPGVAAVVDLIESYARSQTWPSTKEASQLHRK